MSEKPKANVYINPNAAPAICNILEEVLPDANRVSADEMRDIFENAPRPDDKKLGATTMKTDRPKDYSREDVAVWARYCMGSCHGDWSPQAEAIYDEVMRNDETFEFYRKTFEEPKRTVQPGERAPWDED